MLVLIDNYDSFTYNLAQAFGKLGVPLAVFRNDRTTLEELERLEPKGILISPGPCTPKDAGISKDVIRHFAGKVPILGVCLGHQCIAEVFGADVVRAARPMHGKTSEIYHDGSRLFAGIPSPFTATRYHSLVVAPDTVGPELRVTASTSEGDVMALEHAMFPVWGVQFHPESILTAWGPALLANFLQVTSVGYSPVKQA